MAPFLPQVQAQYPRNALLDISPLQNAIEGGQRNALMQQSMGIQQRQADMQEKRFGLEERKFNMDLETAQRERDVREAQAAAGRVQYVQSLKDPAQQQAAWQSLLKQPGFRDLPPEMRDFNVAAPQILAKAAQYIDPLKRREMEADIGLKEANAAKARREASGGGARSLNPVWGTDEQGNPVVGQLGPGGDLVQTRLPPGFRPNPGGTSRVDMGTEWGILDRSGQLISRVPKDIAGKAREEKLGEYEGGAPQRDAGKERLNTILGGLARNYLALDNAGGIINPDRSAVENIRARGAVSDLGQAAAGAVGSENQAIRQSINNSRPLLLQSIMQATGMSARALDSNKELEFYLQAVSDPKRDLFSNLAAIDALDKTFGLGNVLQQNLPPELYKRVSEMSSGMLQQRPIQMTPGAGGGNRAGSSAVPGAGLPRVNSPAEAARLPSGTQFIDGSGNIRQVP